MVVLVTAPRRAHVAPTDGYITDQGYDLGVLVAFSDEIEGLTESKANGFSDTQTAEKFDTDDYRIMVVAEKFQTGFDQPKLAAMYVDKTLTGLAAVQTFLDSTGSTPTRPARSCSTSSTTPTRSVTHSPPTTA